MARQDRDALAADDGGRARIYRAYGLVFRSSLPLPELTETGPADDQAAPDVTVRAGRLPDHLDEPLATGSIHEANADELLLRIEGVGRYLVSRGSRIVVEPDPDASDHEVRVFLLGTCLGALLHQRGFLVLHASGMATEHGAVLFSGVSGAGKSTLLAEMLHRGYRMMVDDVCAVRFDADDRPIVVPSYPRTRIWGETAARLEIDTAGMPRTRPEMDKYERQIPEQFADQPAPLTRLYHLAGSNEDELSLTRLGQLEAFDVVVNNTYRQILLDGFARRGEHFRLAGLAARAASVTRVIRPTTSFRLRELADLIEEDLERP